LAAVRAAARCVAVASLAGAGGVVAVVAVADGALVLSLQGSRHPMRFVSAALGSGGGTRGGRVGRVPVLVIVAGPHVLHWITQGE
jgi:hypothetical protein